MSNLSSVLLYVIPSIIVVAFSSFIRLLALLINSSGLYWYNANTFGSILERIWTIVCLVSPVSFAILPIKSYFVETGKNLLDTYEELKFK